MNKIKRGIQLGGAIVGLTCSSLFALAFIMATFMMDFMFSNYYLDIPQGLYIFVCLFFALFCVAGIVVCSFICTNPDKKQSTHKGFVIAGIVLTALEALLFINSLLCLIPFIACGLLVASLCIPNKEGNVQVETKDDSQTLSGEKQVLENKEEAQTNSSNKNESSTDGKIEKIRSLYAEGVITEAEMKELIIKELKK